MGSGGQAPAVTDDGLRPCGAGDGDRTRMASLEGWSSTIELHPRVPRETRRSLRYRCEQTVLGPDSIEGQLS
jgi:hypothetical protein